MNCFDTFLVCAMTATKKRTSRLDSVPDDPAPAVGTFGSQSVNGTFEAVEIVRNAVYDDFEVLIILVSANFTLVH
jgi:hypothetical protein